MNSIKFLLCFLLAFCYVNTSQALTLEQSINLAVQNSVELKIESKKKDLTAVSKLDAATMFLPNIEAGYRNGHRNTSFAASPDRDLAEDVKSATLTQPLFNGFQGVSKVREAIHKTDAASESLNSKINNIALDVTDAYLNILKLKSVTVLQANSTKYYEKILELANQKLALSEISYSEFTEHELASRRALLAYNNDAIKLRENELKFTNLTNQSSENLSDVRVFTDVKHIDELLGFAQTKNPDIKMATSNCKAADAAVTAEKGKFAPKVSLVLQYEDQKSSYYFNGQGYTNRAAYLNVQIPLFQSGTEYASVMKASRQRQIANLERDLTKQQVETALKEEHHKYISMRQTLDLLKKTAVNVENSLKLAEERFKKKDIGRLDFLLKQVDANDVKMQALNAEYETYLSYYRIKALTNEIFDQSGEIKQIATSQEKPSAPFNKNL